MAKLTAHAFASALDAELNAAAFKDYCPNGLQVENVGEIRMLVTGVTANAALIDAAIELKANALLVHHGIHWKGEDGRLTGFRFARVKQLMDANIALIAYHLPLDAHATMGNNVQLGKVLGLRDVQPLASEPLVLRGKVPSAQTLGAFATLVEAKLHQKPLVIGDVGQKIRTIAWCTGAAQSYFESAIAAGVDAFLTGEISEQHVHIARETGVAFIAAGHHATERYGVQALGAWAAKRFKVAHQFMEIASPV